MEEYKREESRREEPELIDLTHLVEEFWRALRRMFWLPVVLALVCGIVLPLRAWSNYTPQYRSEVMFTIHSTDSGNESDIGTGSGAYYDKAAAEQLAKTFPYIIGSDLLRDFLKQEMGTEVLEGAVTAQSVENTNLFSLQATSPDAQAAYDTLNTVIRIYPRVADYVIGSTKMELVTQPKVAKEPYNSFRPLRTACKGVILGCGLGLVLVFLYGATRRSIREGKEIRSKLNQTCLGTLPQVPVKRRTKQTTQPVLSIRQEKVSSGFQESVRRLRIKLLRELAERRGQVILVTSTQPGEGKTTVASNLALSLSQNGARVILVDLDLRSPAIKRTLGIHAPSKGIAEIMDQGGSVQEALLSLEDSSLRLLAGDAPTADPRKKISSRRLRQILEQLRQDADYVLLDTPPCGLLADSGIVAHLADEAIYVIRAGCVQVSHVLDGIQFLGESGVKLTGCVLNGTRDRHSGYGYSYGYGGYGYGYHPSYRAYGLRKKRDQEATKE